MGVRGDAGERGPRGLPGHSVQVPCLSMRPYPLPLNPASSEFWGVMQVHQRESAW